MEEQQYITVGEHQFLLPGKPPKKQILFQHLPKSEQYWRRSLVIEDIPSFFFDWERGVEENAAVTKYDGKQLVSLSVADTEVLKQYRDREVQRMLDGVWFYNNGEPTYITGPHYGVLVWAAMDDCLNEVELGSLYGQYYQFQRDYAYFIEICKTTKVACGGNVVKPKKTGITMFQELLILIDAITHRSANYRIMSTKEEVATKVNMKYVLYAAKRLPEILKPEYRNNLSAIYFEDTGKGAKAGGKKKSDVEHLETVIETVATVYNSFDSGKNRVAHIDEQSKIKLDKNKTLTTLHNTTIATVFQGMIRVGYVIYTHYVSEVNDDSYRQAKTIYYEGKLRTLNASTGTTQSNLICFALTIQDGIFGGCDKYGKPIKDKIWKYVMAEMEKRKDDPAALRSYRRQMPTCEDDCWIEGAGEASVFGKASLKLGMKLHDLTQDESMGQFSYVDFNFKWPVPPRIDDYRNIYEYPERVNVQPVTNQEKMAGTRHGLWKWYRKELTPQYFIDKHTNKVCRDTKNRRIPNPDSPFYMAIDPTQYSGATEVVTGSHNSMQVFILPNGELDGLFGKKVTNKRPIVEYHHRADQPKDTLDHVVQTLFYFGCYVLIECNQIWLFSRLREMGLGAFLIVMNAETGVLEPYNEYLFNDGKQKPFTSQKSEKGTADTIGDYVAAGLMHLNDSEVDVVEYIDSVAVISDLLNFDTGDTKKFDSGVCYLIGLLGMNFYLGWKQRSGNKAKDPYMRLVVAGLGH
jgi:hypothetical protein